jgi:hypothetical protein
MARTINDFSQFDKIVSLMVNKNCLNCLDDSKHLLNLFSGTQRILISNKKHRNSSNLCREIEQTCTDLDKWQSLIA